MNNGEDGERGFGGDTAVIFFEKMACNENLDDRSEEEDTQLLQRRQIKPLPSFPHPLKK